MGISIKAGSKTDFFIDALTGAAKNSAPFWGEEAQGDFVLKACLRPSFHNIYDAAALFIYQDDTRWIKLAFEQTDFGPRSIVSVVTNGVSDDANHFLWDSANAFLCIARKENQWGLHASKDGESWMMARYFFLPLSETICAGYLVQSPLGAGTEAELSALTLEHTSLSSLRSLR